MQKSMILLYSEDIGDIFNHSRHWELTTYLTKRVLGETLVLLKDLTTSIRICHQLVELEGKAITERLKHSK